MTNILTVIALLPFSRSRVRASARLMAWGFAIIAETLGLCTCLSKVPNCPN